MSNVELIHLPQFALQAALLLAVGLPPRLAWSGAVIAGAVDETYQHLVICAGVPDTYFDWSDIVLNAIGATWAVVLARGGQARRRRCRSARARTRRAGAPPRRGRRRRVARPAAADAARPAALRPTGSRPRSSP
ncbi:MAG: hypothetical protein U0802_08465 [Candidatus Binatia bacterium]